jgi:hypothetical protein
MGRVEGMGVYLMNLYIKELETYFDKNNDVFYFFNNEMLKENIMFKIENNILTVMILEKTNAQEYFMITEANYLAPIQLRRIISDLFIMQKYHTKTEFTRMMRELSEQYITSRSSNKEMADKMFQTMVWEFTLVETMTGGLEAFGNGEKANPEEAPK